MKKFIASLFLLLIIPVTFAASVYKTPRFIVTYTDDGTTFRAINFIGIGVLSPVYVDTTRTFTVNIINKRISNFKPNIMVNVRHQHANIGGDGGLIYIEYHDSPDFAVVSGCDGILPIGATCSITVTFTPVKPETYDGSIQSTQTESLRLYDGYFSIEEFTLTGWQR